ncbi:hypothetical protein FE697_021305 [Mumia zhuanghuii]|uniref:DUF6801 domain-containing protein n=2 Tax=Mumia TaxID=1546255 RepID=A0ABW1QKL0_9ACTN|nr:MULTISPECIES: DUF6801 domain-containing protein [Mumia]KAA1418360.1 hypothetical protein FE697_021305 [Mumia zhuanghuii]
MALVAGVAAVIGGGTSATAVPVKKTITYSCTVTAGETALGTHDIALDTRIDLPDRYPGSPMGLTGFFDITVPSALRAKLVDEVKATAIAHPTLRVTTFRTPLYLNDATLAGGGAAQLTLNNPAAVPTDADTPWVLPFTFTTVNGTIPLGSQGGWGITFPQAFTLAPKAVTAAGEVATSWACTGPAADADRRIGPAELLNRPPVAQGLTVETGKDTPVALPLVASDPDAHTLKYTVTWPDHGSLAGRAPNFTYTPDAGYSGPDGFDYTVSDGLASTKATVKISVADGPVGPPVAEDVALGDLPRGVREVALPVTGGQGKLTYAFSTNDVSVVDRTAKVRSAGALGDRSVTYTVTDAEGRVSNEATITYSVLTAPPEIEGEALVTSKDVPLDIWPWVTDADIGGVPWQTAGEARYKVSYTDGAHGTVSRWFTSSNPEHPMMSAFPEINHKATYSPDPGFVGTDTFDVTVTDLEGGTTTRTFTIDVVDPGAAKRGVLEDVRYRCEPTFRDEDGSVNVGFSDMAGYVVGGDMAFRVDVRADVPQTLVAGSQFRPADTEIDLLMPRQFVRVLSINGQTSVGGSSVSDAVFDLSATGEQLRIPLQGLKATDVPVTWPYASDFLTIPVKGSLPPIAVPQSGTVKVSMPETFVINSHLEPGLMGIIQDVELLCTAQPGTNRLIGTSTVVQPGDAASTVKATIARSTYGQPAVASVTATTGGKAATGAVEIRSGAKVLAKGTLAGGKATVRIPAKALTPGTRRLTVAYAGGRGVKPSQTTVTAVVAKASSRVSAKVVTKKVVAKKTRAKLVVTVRTPAGVPATGKVKVTLGGKTVGTAVIRSGKASVSLKKLPKGTKRLTVRYAGSSTVAGDATTVKVKVRAR